MAVTLRKIMVPQVFFKMLSGCHNSGENKDSEIFTGSKVQFKTDSPKVIPKRQTNEAGRRGKNPQIMEISKIQKHRNKTLGIRVRK